MPKQKPILTIDGVQDTLVSLDRIREGVKQAAVGVENETLARIGHGVGAAVPYDTGALEASIGVTRLGHDTGPTRRAALAAGAAMHVGGPDAPYANIVDRQQHFFRAGRSSPVGRERRVYAEQVFDAVEKVLHW